MSINIFGEIGFDVTASDVFDQIQNDKSEELDIVISSGGGSAFEGLMIFDMLKASDKKINTKIMGLGASAASVIFMAGDTREMGDGSLLMVHNSWSMFMGNAKEVRDQLGTLEAIDSRMTAIFMKATGLEESKVKELLEDETFMSVDEAVDFGFATAQTEASKVAASLYNSYNKTKEPVNMATEEETKETGFFAHMKAYFVKSEVKAEDEEVMPDEEEAKAEEDGEEEIIVEDSVKAEGDEEEVIEEAKAEGDDEEEVDVEALQAELVAAVAKTEEVTQINSLVMSALQDNKILLSNVSEMSKGSLEDVKSRLDGIGENATKRGSEGEPVKGSDVSAYERYKAIKDPRERSAFMKENKAAVIATDPVNLNK